MMRGKVDLRRAKTDYLRKTGLARGTVNKHIQILIDKGYLNRVRYRQDYSNTLELEIIVENLTGQGVTENDTPPQGGCHGG